MKWEKRNKGIQEQERKKDEWTVEIKEKDEEGGRKQKKRQWEKGNQGIQERRYEEWREEG